MCCKQMEKVLCTNMWLHQSKAFIWQLHFAQGPDRYSQCSILVLFSWKLGMHYCIKVYSGRFSEWLQRINDPKKGYKYFLKVLRCPRRPRTYYVLPRGPSWPWVYYIMSSANLIFRTKISSGMHVVRCLKKETRFFRIVNNINGFFRLI